MRIQYHQTRLWRIAVAATNLGNNVKSPDHREVKPPTAKHKKAKHAEEPIAEKTASSPPKTAAILSGPPLPPSSPTCAVSPFPAAQLRPPLPPSSPTCAVSPFPVAQLRPPSSPTRRPPFPVVKTPPAESSRARCLPIVSSLQHLPACQRPASRQHGHHTRASSKNSEMSTFSAAGRRPTAGRAAGRGFQLGRISARCSLLLSSPRGATSTDTIPARVQRTAR
jgi:hypothetical protein